MNDQTTTPTTGPGAHHVPQSVIVALFVSTTIVSALVLYSLVTFWPAAGPAGQTPAAASQPVTWFGWHVSPSRGQAAPPPPRRAMPARSSQSPSGRRVRPRPAPG